MDRIEARKTAREDDTTTVDLGQKKKVTRGLMNNAGIFVGVFLIFAVIVVVTTDIGITSFVDLAALGLDFFLLLFCSYSMYINASDSGMRHGLVSEAYADSLARYGAMKKSVIDAGRQTRLPEFCHHYVQTELENARMAILAVAGLTYADYCERWIGLDKKAVSRLDALTSVQKAAIVKANTIRPIKLTAEMIMKRGRGSSRRAPLGMKPETRKGVKYGTKFATSFLISLVMSVIVLDIVIEPSWVIFASCMLKLLAIVMNGFTGYKFGYENIVFDTVNYMDDQTDLLGQAMQYFDTHPIETKA